MSRNEVPLFRDGKAILKVRDNLDGSLTLFKPFTIKPVHIMSITGAPGWDQRYVDQVFPPGQAGQLEYIESDGRRLSMPIGEFREHAFVKEIHPYGAQYNVHRKYWHEIGFTKVSPLREERVSEIPTKFKFGEFVPCPSCKAKTQKARTCQTCQGTGLTKA